MIRSSNSKGQTLIPFALLLLLLAVLVSMAMSVQMKIREKIDLQTAADAAAYSSATVVARSFNLIAIVNRTQVSQMVAVGGVQSLISWSSVYRAHVAGAKASMNGLVTEAQGRCGSCRAGNGGSAGCACECGDLARLQTDAQTFAQALDAEEQRIASLWEEKDKAAADQARAIRAAAAALAGLTDQIYRGDVRFKSRPQRVAFHVAREAARGTPWNYEWRAPHANDFVSIREIDTAVSAGAKAASDRDRMLEAAMGTRGFSFVTGRGEDAPFTKRLVEILQRSGASATILAKVAGSGGSTYYDFQRSHGTEQVSDTYLWAEDHGMLQLTFQGSGAQCGGFGTSIQTRGEAWVRFSKMSCGCSDAHYWTGGSDAYEKHYLFNPCPKNTGGAGQTPTIGPRPSQDFEWNDGDPHTCEPCQADDEDVAMPLPAFSALPLGALSENICDEATISLWPPFLDHQRGMSAADLYGQPKLYSILQRDYKKRGERSDPWGILNHMPSPLTGNKSEIDTDGQYLSDGTDISLQTAVAASVTYYHHFGGMGWREDANFLNPFWRSTLVPVDIDEEGKGIDLPVTLKSSKASLAAKTVTALRAAGFEGFQ